MAKILRQRVYRCFVIRHFLIHVALVPFICFEFFDVFVRLLFGLTAFVLNDFTQRCVDVLGHSASVAANKEVRAFAFHPQASPGPPPELCLPLSVAFLVKFDSRLSAIRWSRRLTGNRGLVLQKSEALLIMQHNG